MDINDELEKIISQPDIWPNKKSKTFFLNLQLINLFNRVEADVSKQFDQEFLGIEELINRMSAEYDWSMNLKFMSLKHLKTAYLKHIRYSKNPQRSKNLSHALTLVRERSIERRRLTELIDAGIKGILYLWNVQN